MCSVEMIFLAFLVPCAAELKCRAVLCPETKVSARQRGNAECDPGCLSPQCNFDSAQGPSDCASLCLLTCNETHLANGICDAGGFYSDCNNAECAWDHADCGYCAPGCNYYAGFYAMLGDNHCDFPCDTASCDYDGGDCATEIQRLEVTVAAGEEDRKDADYGSIEDALGNMWGNFIVIWLFPGIHSLQTQNNSSSVSVTGDVKIAGFPCEYNTMRHCGSATVQIAPQPLALEITGTLTIANVTITGEVPLVADCLAATCYYCPSAMLVREGLWVDSSGNDLGQFAPQEVCDRYRDFVLMTVFPEGNLHLMSTVFTDIRFQLRAIILSHCGSISLTNVQFSNINTQQLASESAVIILRSTDCKRHSRFSYVGGTVELLNNGYELTTSAEFSGFLVADSVDYISISSVTFQYSNAMSGDSIDSYLLFLNSVPIFSVANCTFLRNSVSTAVVSLTSTVPTQVSIANTTFQENVGRISSALHIEFSTLGHYIDIVNCTFLRNTALQEGIVLVHLEAAESLHFPPSILRATNILRVIAVIATDNTAPVLLGMEKVAKVTISQLFSAGNGDREDYLEELFSLLFSHPKLSQSMVPRLQRDPCKGTVVLRDIGELAIQDCYFAGSMCEDGSPGLTVTALQGNAAVGNLSFVRNLGEKLLSIETSQDLFFSNLYFFNNSNTRTAQAVCLHLAALSPISVAIHNSQLLANVGFQHTIGRIANVISFTLSSTIAANNTALRTSAGVLISPFTMADSKVEVVNCIFTNNSAFANGVIAVVDWIGEVASTEFRITLTVADSVFIGNFATIGGSAVTISGIVFLSSESRIQNCIFRGNICGSGGAAVYIQLASGSLLSASQERQSLVTVTNSRFLNNTGESIISVTNCAVATLYCVFAGSCGSAVHLVSAQWSDAASVFTQNHGIGSGTVLLVDSASGSLFSSQFAGNTAQEHGAGLDITANSTVICTFCTFDSNLCGTHGGAINAEFSVFVGYRVTFRGNFSPGRGSAVFAAMSEFGCKECVIEENLTEKEASVFMFTSTGFVEGSTFQRNAAVERTPGLLLTMSNITVVNCTFLNQSSNSGAFIYASDQSLITVIGSSFRCGFAQKLGGCIYTAISSTLTLLQSSLEDCLAAGFGNVVGVNSGTLVMRAVVIEGVQGRDYSSSVFLAQGAAILDGMRFQRIRGNAITAIYSTVSIRNSDFSGIYAYRGPALCCVECFYVLLHSSSFSFLEAKNGGAVFTYSAGTYTIEAGLIATNSSFTSNHAVNGGAIAAEGVGITVTGCTFTNNTASGEAEEMLFRGAGGAIYLVSPNAEAQVSTITGNRFLRNCAEVQGGALYWSDRFPTFTHNTVEGNCAPYGPAVASFPVRLGLVDSNDSTQPYLHANLSMPVVLSLAGVASGQPFPSLLRIALIDQYDQIYTVNYTFSAQIQSLDAANSYVSGTTQVKSVRGIFEFGNVTFVGQPHTLQRFKVESDAVDVSRKKYTKDPSEYFPVVEIEVEFRECRAGESYQGLSCYECPAGTFSLSPSEHCTSCPSSALCLGGAVMVPKPGYWRPDPTSKLFCKCPNEDACLGSPGSFPSLQGDCAAGYSGNLCATCEPGYSKFGRDLCRRCLSTTSSAIITAIIAPLCLALLALTVVLAIRGAMRPRSRIAIYVKILVNYCQMVVFAGAMDLNWPKDVRAFLTGQRTVGALGENFFSLDCLLAMWFADIYYAKTVMMVSLPMALILAAGIVWGGLFLCGKVESVLNKLIASTVVIIFVLHPSLTRSLIEVFSCRELSPSEFWLAENLSVRCWKPTHIRYILTLVLPGLIVWTLGLPMLSFLLMFRCRKALHDPLTCLKFSFLYKGYTAKYFYWEYTILYRKVALACTLVLFSTVSTTVQGLSVFAVLLVFLLMQIHMKPYCLPGYNRLELDSIFVSLVTIYAGLYFQTKKLGKAYIDSSAVFAVFVLMIGANAYFLGWWVKEVAPIVIESMKRRIWRVTSESQLAAASPRSQELTPAPIPHRSVSDSQVSIQLVPSRDDN